jgi:hypothetical protein
MSAPGLGCAKTKSDLIVRAEDKFFRFLALRITTEPKIPGAIIPRRVFAQPGSLAEVGGLTQSPRRQVLKASAAPGRRGRGRS